MGRAKCKHAWHNPCENDTSSSAPQRHVLRNKATRNNQNRNLLVISRTPLLCKAIEFCLLNTRSIKNKATILNDCVIEEKIDIKAFTEAWLLPGDIDQAVKSDLTPKGYVFRRVSREKRGFGVAVLSKKSLLTKVNPSQRFRSFEYIDTVIKSSSKTFRLVIV